MEANPLPEIVVCRPDKGCWAFVVIFGFVGLLMPLLALFAAPHDATLWCMTGLAFASFGVPAVLFAIWIVRGYVIADNAGLRCRGLGGWRTTPWDGISDYCEKVPSAKSHSRWYVVEVQCGKLTLRGDYWSKADVMCAVIAQRSTAARAKKWAVLGTRPELDWPRTFDYDNAENRSTKVFIRVTALFFAGLAVWLVTQSCRNFSLGLGWGLASVGLALLLGMALLLFVSFPLLMVQDTERRRTQSIMVSHEGLLYSDGGQRITMLWEEIADYSLKGFGIWQSISQYHIGGRKNAIIFTPAIHESHILKSIISDNAVNVPAKSWYASYDDVLGGKASRWSSGSEGVGERVYHYRSRSLRAMLLFPTVLAFVPLLLVPLASMGLMPKPNWVPDTLFCGFALWGWWRYSVAHIQVDASGITQRAIFGHRRLRWEQVEYFYMSGSDGPFTFGNVVGAGTRIRFWIGIADLEELKAEIARRAVNSRSRTWDEAGLTAAQDG